MDSNLIALDFLQIRARILHATFPPADAVVAIARGGVVPGSLIAFRLGLPLYLLHLSHRDDSNTPLYDNPIILTSRPIPADAVRLLLVDDVSVTGKTLAVARAALSDRAVTSVVMKGAGEIVLFPELVECVAWPWRIPRTDYRP